MTALWDGWRSLGKETAIVSGLHLVAFFVTFNILMPIQGLFFPEFASFASLLYLPHGVRILAAWLLGWRATVALLPGVFISFSLMIGMGVFEPSRLFAVVVAITAAPATFHLLYYFGWDFAPRADRTPCWPCIMGVGVIVSIIISLLTNLSFGSNPADYFAYLIGDVAGLFFLMLILMFTFRRMRENRT